MTATKIEAWEESYGRRENFTFVPSEELVRFMGRFLRRRVGLDEIIDLNAQAGDRVADFGCGIGRSLIFGTQMGFEMYGVDLSHTAIVLAQEWLGREIGPELAQQRVVQGDIRALPWPDDFIDHGWSDGAIDSMTNEIAKVGVAEIARVMKSGGYYYCNLISGDRKGKDPSFTGDEVVDTRHELGTIQSYYDETTVRDLFEEYFEFVNFFLLDHRSVIHDVHHGRWQMVMRRR